MSRTWILAAVLVLGVQTALGLSIGDKAPPLIASKWIVGEAVSPDKPDGKTTYIVDFWASWCGPSRTAIPIFMALQAKYRDRGLVVVGISDEDEATVRKYVNDTRITYTIGIDPERVSFKTYMAGIDTIPHSFVVNKEGVVIWAGNPLEGIEDAVARIFAGTYDLEKAKETAKLREELTQAVRARDVDKALAATNKLIVVEPLEYSHLSLKVTLLRHKQDLPAIRETRKQAAVSFKASAPALNDLAWDILNDDSPESRDIALALECAENAVRITERKNGSVLDTLALAYYRLCLIEKAAATEAEAAAVAQDEDSRKEFEQLVQYYQTVKATRDKLIAPAK